MLSLYLTEVLTSRDSRAKLVSKDVHTSVRAMLIGKSS